MDRITNQLKKQIQSLNDNKLKNNYKHEFNIVSTLHNSYVVNQYKISFELIDIDKLFSIICKSSFDTNSLDLCRQVLCSYIITTQFDTQNIVRRMTNLISNVNL